MKLSGGKKSFIGFIFWNMILLAYDLINLNFGLMAQFLVTVRLLKDTIGVKWKVSIFGIDQFQTRNLFDEHMGKMTWKQMESKRDQVPDEGGDAEGQKERPH